MNAQAEVAEEVVQAEQTSVAEYQPTEAALAELQKIASAKKWDLTITSDMDDARKCRRQLVSLRTSLERKSKELKKPPQGLISLLNSEQQRIEAAIKKIEEPIDEQIKAQEAKDVARKEAKRLAEDQRQEAILDRVREFRAIPEGLVGASSQDIGAAINELQNIKIDDSFAEFQGRAVQVATEVVERLESMATKALESEKIARDLEAKAAELQRQQEAADKERAERDRVAQQERARLDEQAALIRTQNEKLAATKRDQDAREQAIKDAEVKAERDRIAAIKTEEDRTARVKEERLAVIEAKKQRKLKAAADAKAARLELKRQAELARAQRMASVGESGYELAKMVRRGIKANADLTSMEGLALRIIAKVEATATEAA